MVTQNENLVHIVKVWVGPMVDQDVILGMDIMNPAGLVRSGGWNTMSHR